MGDGISRPLLWAREGERWFVFATDPHAGWLSQVRRRGWVEAELPGIGQVRCEAEVVEASEVVDRLRSTFRTKYGTASWERHFTGPLTLVALLPTLEVSSRSVVARTRGEFDLVARRYHARLLSRPTELYAKERVLRRLLDLFATVDPLLEIGPGSGFETLPLLAAGHHVTAVDVSEPMLGVLRERAEEAGVAARLTTRSGRLARLGEAIEQPPEGGFGGACSTFGAFNLEPEAVAVGSELFRLLRPRARLAFTTLNRPGLFPVLWEAALGHPRAALRRLETSREVMGEGFPIDSYPRRPDDWDRYLGDGFRRIASLPVSVLLPPVDLDRRLGGLGERGRRALRSIDLWLSERPSLSPFGEWSLLVYERLPSPGSTAAPADRGVGRPRV